MTSFSKTPQEIKKAPVSISDELDGQTVTSATVVVFAQGLMAGASLIASIEPTATGGLIDLSAGTDGEVYRVDAAINLSDGQLIERSITVHVIDLDFAAPYTGGPSPYISPKAYLDRFGIEELIMLTGDEVFGVDRVNKVRFFAGIKDAHSEMDTILSEKYQVPSSTPPPILEATAAVITRLKLHGFADNMPDHVKDAANQARSQLRNLVRSDAIIDGLTVRSQTAATPIVSGGDAQFGPFKMEGF